MLSEIYQTINAGSFQDQFASYMAIAFVVSFFAYVIYTGYRSIRNIYMMNIKPKKFFNEMVEKGSSRKGVNKTEG